MRWLAATVLFCACLAIAVAEPEPKKYKPKTKDDKNNTSLTEEERKFLREVEAKFGIKADIPIEKQTNITEEKEVKHTNKLKTPFPAIIAIEIVNDTDTNTKGKRTIDANLGYGYRTNNGYTYTYFGKPTQEKGKFMIYPYSQEDIPPARSNQNKHYGQTQNKNVYPQKSTRYHNNKPTPTVEIQPSRAFELVTTQEEQSAYQSKQQPADITNYQKGVESSQYSYTENSDTSQAHTPSQTLYTTYNGGQLSGLSGQFPMVMPNYFIEPSQLLHNPQFQSAGVTSDHLRSHGPQLEQRVVPVLVLRVPSSYLRNPSAELYANLPHNYPLSQYLNNVNIQELVNQYFKKIGYPYAPQIMSYQSPIEVPTSNYEPQQYATPQVAPMYTHADYSGLQYSAVQPVMAKYPIINSQQYSEQQYQIPQRQTVYQHGAQHPQYQYQYQYMQPSHAYYYPQYQQTAEEEQIPVQQEISSTYGIPQAGVDYGSVEQNVMEYVQPNKPHAKYGPANHVAPPTTQYGPSKTDYTSYITKTAPSADYGPTKVALPVYNIPKTHSIQYEAPQTEYEAPKTEYEAPKAEYGPPKTEYGPPKVEYEPPKVEYGPPKAEYGPPNSAYEVPKTVTAAYIAPKPPAQEYGSPNIGATGYSDSQINSSKYKTPKFSIQYSTPQQVSQKDIYNMYASNSAQNAYKYEVNPGGTQTYIYQKYIGPDSQSKSLVISENYPSKDHTQASVLPQGYNIIRHQNKAPVQTVKYVTPTPFSSNYQQRYNVMVPQTSLKNDEKVSYVNSHSIPSHYSQADSTEVNSNSEEEYKVDSSYVPPIGSQKPPAFPRNYHGHPKRMVKNEKQESSSVTKKEKLPERTTEKKTS